MASSSTSQWRVRSRQVIAEVMAHRTGDPLAGRLLADWYRDHIPGLIEEGQ